MREPTRTCSRQRGGVRRPGTGSGVGSTPLACVSDEVSAGDGSVRSRLSTPSVDGAPLVAVPSGRGALHVAAERKRGRHRRNQHHGGDARRDDLSAGCAAGHPATARRSAVRRCQVPSGGRPVDRCCQADGAAVAMWAGVAVLARCGGADGRGPRSPESDPDCRAWCRSAPEPEPRRHRLDRPVVGPVRGRHDRRDAVVGIRPWSGPARADADPAGERGPRGGGQRSTGGVAVGGFLRHRGRDDLVERGRQPGNQGRRRRRRRCSGVRTPGPRSSRPG